MMSTVTGQLRYTDGQDNSGVPDPAGNGDEAGVVNSNGSSATTLLSPPPFSDPPPLMDPWYTGIAVDTAGNFSGDTLTLTGSATLAHYQTALDSVGYSSTAADPTAGGGDPTRTISWQVDDGFASSNLSNILTSTITETAGYLQGTGILTERGEVGAEDLRIGDLAVTASGGLRAIKWIGRRSYSARFARNNPDLVPIRFKAGSLADNVPARDLLVSPHHAMFLDDVLVPAEQLVNGATIVRETPTQDIHYFHIELDSHDVLIAEGAPSESFVDDASRAMFENAREFHAFYPEAGPPEALYCAPRVESGHCLDRIRRRLAARAGLAFVAPMEIGELSGAVETCAAERLAGWASNGAFPDGPVCLDVYVDDALLCHAYADRARDGGGRRFVARFPAPLDSSRRNVISVRRSADGVALGKSVCFGAAEALDSAA
jgi:hypothetical protein